LRLGRIGRFVDYLALGSLNDLPTMFTEEVKGGLDVDQCQFPRGVRSLCPMMEDLDVRIKYAPIFF
jgi:hypothetical protein